MKLFRHLPGLVAGVALSACATTDYAARAAGERPSDLSSTEASLWYQMDEAEDKLAVSGRVVDDETLNAFVADMTCRLTDEYCSQLRSYIVREPVFNAFMAPNGMMVVNTGLLLRAENESELAFVLSHEFVHFQENHSYERYGSIKNANVYGTILATVLAGVGGGSFASLGYMMTYSGAAAFGREQETEADLKGMDRLADAGYNPRSGSRLWSNLLDELNATSIRTKKKKAVKNQADIYDSHPVISARITAIDSRAIGMPDVETHDAAYRDMIRPFLKDWLDDEIVKRDYGATLQLISRLSAQGTDAGILRAAEGRTLMLRGETGDTEAARAAFEAAIAMPDVPADAHRTLADIYRADGLNDAACAEYAAYLAAEPGAADRSLIQSIISTLGGKTT